MQQNSAEFRSKLSTSPEYAPQQPMSSNAAHLPRAANNPRFAVTPETMGLNFCRDTSAKSSRTQQCQPTIPVVVDVKPYNERRSNRYSAAEISDCSQESSTSHYLPFKANSKNELMTQSSSPINSPPTPQQQWNFEQSTTNNESSQPNVKISAANYMVLPALKCAQEELRKSEGRILDNASAAASSHGASAQVISMPEPQTPCHDATLNHSALLNFKVINGLYERRIADIDANAWGDKDLKICTYQEWIEVLVRINEAFLSNMEELEKEVADRLALVQTRVNTSCRHSQGNELMKCRKDIYTLLKYIKNTSNNKKGDILSGLTLETLPLDQVLERLDFDSLTLEDNNAAGETKNYHDSDAVQIHKLYANVKALAQEVAEKHDEVRELKRQVICLEDEIQKAQKKIQLKDDVIKELRNDLKCAGNNKIPSNSPSETSLSMLPINLDHQITSTQLTDNTSTSQMHNASQYESLIDAQLDVNEKIKTLQHELNDFIEIGDSKKVHEAVTKLVLEKKDAYGKLEFVRQQLINLECESNEGKSDYDSGFRSNTEHDQYDRLLEAIRQRLRRRNDTICELKEKIQKLELKNNEFSNSLQTETSYSARNSEILKEVADLLCDLRGKQFSYTGLYNPCHSQPNPFCEAIMEMEKDFQAKQAQLLQDLKAKNKEIEELTQLVLESEKVLNQEKTLCSNLNDFEDNDKTPVAAQTACTSPPPPPTPQLSPILATTVTKPSLTSSTVQPSDNVPTTTLERLVAKSPHLKDVFF